MGKKYITEKHNQHIDAFNRSMTLKRNKFNKNIKCIDRRYEISKCGMHGKDKI